LARRGRSQADSRARWYTGNGVFFSNRETANATRTEDFTCLRCSPARAIHGGRPHRPSRPGWWASELHTRPGSLARPQFIGDMPPPAPTASAVASPSLTARPFPRAFSASIDLQGGDCVGGCPLPRPQVCSVSPPRLECCSLPFRYRSPIDMVDQGSGCVRRSHFCNINISQLACNSDIDA
jgi:hypothetical protein